MKLPGVRFELRRRLLHFVERGFLETSPQPIIHEEIDVLCRCCCRCSGGHVCTHKFVPSSRGKRLHFKESKEGWTEKKAPTRHLLGWAAVCPNTTSYLPVVVAMCPPGENRQQTAPKSSSSHEDGCHEHTLQREAGSRSNSKDSQPVIHLEITPAGEPEACSSIQHANSHRRFLFRTWYTGSVIYLQMNGFINRRKWCYKQDVAPSTTPC